MTRAAVLALAAGLAAAQGAAGESVVARARLRGAAPDEPTSTVFFLAAPAGPGVVAVGAAHSYDPTALAEAGALEMHAPDGSAVATATRYYARPGVPYHRPGATLRDDFVLFAPDAAPEGVRLLEPAAGLPEPGERVRVIGAPAGRDAVVLDGVVVGAEPGAIEVDLPAAADLRGFGGAPVVSVASGRVLGLLQSARPAADGRGLRLGVGPLGGVVAALAEPLEGGLGRLFATLAPPPSAATAPDARRQLATGSIFGDRRPEENAAAVEAAGALRSRSTRRPHTVRVDIVHPQPDAVVGDAAGFFVAGRALALYSGATRFDLVFAIDRSGSTGWPTGLDLDGDGLLGVLRPSFDFQFENTDPDDSILAAQIQAAERLVSELDPLLTRASIVSFAGEPPPEREVKQSSDEVEAALAALPFTPPPIVRTAITEEALTSDLDRLREALHRVREAGASGGTHMAAGIDQASVELLGLEGSTSRTDPSSEKVILFFTDGLPTYPDPGSEATNVRAVLAAAVRARRVGIRIHSFAVGPEALGRPISTVEMASITDGIFTPVRHPGELVRFMETVSFARIEEVAVRNASAGRAAFATRLRADGSWDALVPLEPGENRLEVRARADDGAEATATLRVVHEAGAESPLPVELLSRRTALLEARRDTLELERVEAMRRELVIEIERERAAAEERAARQRKELELEVQAPGAR